MAFVFRARPRDKVMFEAQWVSLRQLAARFSPGVVRWYPKLRRYAKRVSGVIQGVGSADVLIVWRSQGFGWHLTAFVSTLKGGVQEVIREAFCRWSLEVSHRTRKQNLAVGACSCPANAAHLLHADLVITTFNLMREERIRRPGLSWKRAQVRAAQRLEQWLLTEGTRVAA